MSISLFNLQTRSSVSPRQIREMVSTSTVKTATARRETGSKSGLICRVKYTNTLPDIPSDSKSIKYPFKRDRFIKYKPTTLEKLCKVELHTDFDLGVNIDLINPETYIRPPQAELHPDDNALLQDDDMKKSDTRRSNIHRKKHTFFRASEYISQDFKQYGVSKERTESRIDIKEKFKDEEIYKDREAQIKAIEATFADAVEEVSDHYSKPGVHAVEVMPLLPDFDMWQHACAQVIFDTDPAPRQTKNSGAKSHEIMSQAMIRGMQDEDNDQFVAYFLPTDATLDKRDNDRKVGLNYEEDETYDYKLTKEYNWNVKNKASKGYEENFFFCYRPGQGVFYNELETRIRLSKRVKSRDQKAQHSNTILAVQHREMDEQERLAQTMRLDAWKHADPNDSDDDDSSSDDSDANDSDNSTAQTPARQPGSDEDTVQRAGGAAGAAGSDSDSDQSEHNEQQQQNQPQQKKTDSSSDDDEAGSDEERQNNPFGSDSDEADSDSD